MKKLLLLLPLLFALNAQAVLVPITTTNTLEYTPVSYDVDLKKLKLDSNTGTWNVPVTLVVTAPTLTETAGVQIPVRFIASGFVTVYRSDVAAASGQTEEFVRDTMGGTALRQWVNQVGLAKLNAYFGF